MLRFMLKTKIHRATVTEADVAYEGSITIDRDLMDAAGIVPFEQVGVYNINNGERFETYVIEGDRGTGVIGLNGAAARKGLVGDLIIVAAAVVWALYSVFGRRVMRNRSPVAATALSNFLGLPLIAAAAVYELQHISLNLRVETIAAIVHICVVPTIIGYWSWNRAVGILGAGGAMVFFNTLPLYGVILGALFLNESVGVIHLIFGGLILGGGLWATLGKTNHHDR